MSDAPVEIHIISDSTGDTASRVARAAQAKAGILPAVGLMIFGPVFLGGVAGISLLVGGIGIMNIMLVSVTERTREIGILASIGMKSWKILVLFLTESGMLAVGGIIMGLALGLASTTFFSSHGFYIGNMGITGMMIGNTIYTELTMDDTIRLSIIAFVVTLLAGIYPAIIAARLEPVDALRGNK